jgi:hypothetical protein
VGEGARKVADEGKEEEGGRAARASLAADSVGMGLVRRGAEGPKGLRAGCARARTGTLFQAVSVSLGSARHTAVCSLCSLPAVAVAPARLGRCLLALDIVFEEIEGMRACVVVCGDYLVWVGIVVRVDAAKGGLRYSDIVSLTRGTHVLY